MREMTRAEQIALLREAIARSGLSNRQYAERVLMRDERTLRRWLSGKQSIPIMVVRRSMPKVSPHETPTALVALLREYGELVILGRSHDVARQADWLAARGVVVLPPDTDQIPLWVSDLVGRLNARVQELETELEGRSFPTAP